MNFQIPQFIDIESKIVGPLSLRQFLYFAGAGGISFALFFILQIWLWFLITVFLAAITIILAFIKYNGQPLPKIIWMALGFLWKPRLYLWQREAAEEKIISMPNLPKIESATSKREKLRKFFSEAPSVKKLWQNLLTTKNPLPKREKIAGTPFWGKREKEKFQVFRKITGERTVTKRVDYR